MRVRAILDDDQFVLLRDREKRIHICWLSGEVRWKGALLRICSPR